MSGRAFPVVYAVDVERCVRFYADLGWLRDPADMPWGERVAYVADPEGNAAALATQPG